MMCAYSQNDVALFVEGDLPEAKCRDFEAHLGECQSCRDLAEELRESQAFLKSLRQGVVTPAAIAEVRNRVLAEVTAARSRTPWGRWLYALAGVSFVAVISVTIWTLHSPPRGGGVAAPSIERREATEAAQTGGSLEHNVAAKPVAHTTSPKRRAPKQAVLKLMTEDPNVIIYWLINENGG